MDRFELRRQARMAMRGVPERLGLRFADGNIEMRAKPNGTGGTSFEYSGYASVFSTPFPMWDQNGEPFTEYVAPGAFRRALANPNLDVPFLIGHNDAGIPLGRTKSGTMQLSEDSHGLLVHVPAMDGRREEVRALASAVERGDMDEMSLAFICNRQQWDRNYEERGILEADPHRGDVCAVTHGANDATAGASMRQVEQLSFRRPVAIGAPAVMRRERRALERRMPTAPYQQGADEHCICAQCGSGNDCDAAYCDQCGTEMVPMLGYVEHPDDTQVCPWCREMNSPDAKVCDQCGRGMVNDHDGDDPGYPGGAQSWRFDPDCYATGRPLERRAAMSTADVNDLPDSVFAYIEPGGTKDESGRTVPRSKRHFQLNDAAHVRNALARAPQSPFGPKAMPAIRAAAAKMGIGVAGQHAAMRPAELRASSHPPFTGTHSHPHPAYGDQGGDATHDHEHSHDGDAAHGHAHEGRASGRPLERRASAADDLNTAVAPDYDPDLSPHEPMTGTHEHAHVHPDGEQITHPHQHRGDADHSCATSAVIEVDGQTGIPGPEEQLSAARRLELRLRELEMEELARL